MINCNSSLYGGVESETAAETLNLLIQSADSDGYLQVVEEEDPMEGSSTQQPPKTPHQ